VEPPETPTPPPTDDGEITELLRAARAGDGRASERLFEAVYGELKRLARAQLARVGRSSGARGERATVDTTALVHEAYFKLASPAGLAVEDRRHFLNLAARVMRHLLVDFARQRGAEKRGGELVAVALEDAGEIAERRAELELSAELLALDDALGELDQSAPDLARLVELRFFVGLPLGEIVEILGRSERSLKRDWRRARAFLLAKLGGANGLALPDTTGR
jgi:RNA polymerase sigma factor (TIGR02999 family)